MMVNARNAWLWIVALGLVVRVVLAAWNAAAGPMFGADADAINFQRFAVGVSEGEVRPGTPILSFAFAYVLGLIYRVTGPSLLVGSVISCLVWALSAVLLARTLRLLRVPTAPDCESSRHLYQVLVDRRDQVMVALNQEQIYPGVHYRDNTVYPMYANQPSCPRARRASDRVISLPLHLQMEQGDVARVCDALRRSTRQRP